ncbi:hypothetical protein [Actinomadura alba]|uniref:Transcriptional regulator n=1 Tax=Actinomadura alba TaxID=406431 RepID=A0ABR7LQJ9_9ACTN|nr:hypothetical protein [Actinomadura alba]MBC6466938.1 hypothetical protein [Actinomadura alba]
MELKDATRVILMESAAQPDLLRHASNVYDEFAADRQVHYSSLSWMLKRAVVTNVLAGLKERDNATFTDVVTTLTREIDRQAPVRR